MRSLLNENKMNNNRRYTNKNRNTNSRYSEHDNRTVHFGPQRNRGGGFKSRPPRKSGFVTKRYDRPINPRSRLEDGDVDMDGDSTTQSPSRRFRPYGNRSSSSSYVRSRGGIRPVLDNKDQIVKSLGGQFRDSTLGKSDWYRVSIPHGKKTEKSVLLKSLADHMNNAPLVPFHYQYEGHTAVFYVNELSTAQALRDCSRQITAPTGHKVIVMVRASAAPYPQMNNEVTEKLKVTMSNRYDPSSKNLNLSALYDDSSLKQEGIHLTLNKYPVMKAVLAIIESNIPELVSLDLSNNKLYTLDSLQHLHEKTPGLKRISVGQNQLKSEHDLDALKKLEVEELMLDGNPLCDKFKDEVSYVR